MTTPETHEKVYPKGTIGEMIDPYFLSFPQSSTVKDAVETIRLLANGKLSLNYAYVVDDSYRLVGVLNMRDLLFASDHDRLENIMLKNVYAVNANRDREEVANEAKDKRFIAMPVVNDEGHLLGTLKYKDLITAAQEEASEDIQKMFGAGAEERVDSSIGFMISKRLPWLNVNLFTAFLASGVISMFEGTIARITALAVFLPIVASQGGNAGAQSLAVVMRGLALGEIPHGKALALIAKETLAGTLNGIAIGIVTGLVTWIWHGSPIFGAVIAAAMVGNMVTAACIGASTPIVMKRLGFDPAQCSNIILTTFTDIIGFLLFLGLASAFRDRLV